MSALRNELKFYLNTADAILLQKRLCTVLKKDKHTKNDSSYLVQSLYFDDPSASSFYDKLDGIENRSKYRIRFYNDDFSYIRVEKKEKLGKFCRKTSERISCNEAQVFAHGCREGDNKYCGLKGEFSNRIVHERFRPLIYLSYRRNAFVYPVGNVRITLDSVLKASHFSGDLKKPYSALVPIIDDSETILEVKFDSYLPPFISELLTDIPKQISAISKFCKGIETLY